MACIYKEVKVAVNPDKAWQAVRDVGALQRLFPGVVTATEFDGEARVVTFANGLTVRELIVDINDERRRVSYASVGGRPTHHNASVQVFADGADGGGSRIAWTTDVLPNELVPLITPLVDAGSAAMKRALEGGSIS